MKNPCTIKSMDCFIKENSRFLCSHRSDSGFSLIELSIVLMIAALLMAGAINYMSVFMSNSQQRTIKARLQTIQLGLQDYVERFGMLPCPSSLTAIPGTPDFGTSLSCQPTPVTVGTCSEDGAYCIQAGRLDPNLPLDKQTPARVRIGGVPVRSINVPFEEAGDPWGYKILYAVAEDMAVTSEDFSRQNGAIGIIDETNTSVITPPYSATYVLVSQGPDGAGAIPVGGRRQSIGCPGDATMDGENCDYAAPGRPAIFRAAFYAKADGPKHYDDVIAFDTRGNTHGAGVPRCKDMPVCEESSISTQPVCQVPGGSDGLPMCTHRVDVKSGLKGKDDYEHNAATWREACNLGSGWSLPSLAELQVLYSNRAAIGGFQSDTYYLTRSYYNPTSIENPDRKQEVWAKRFVTDTYGTSDEKSLNISPDPSDNGKTGRIRCILR